VDLCDYNQADWPPAVRLEMFRDRFVFSLHDDTLKERLLRETKAVEIALFKETDERDVYQSTSYQKVRDCSTAQSTVAVLRCNIVVVVDEHISQNNIQLMGRKTSDRGRQRP